MHELRWRLVLFYASSSALHSSIGTLIRLWWHIVGSTGWIWEKDEERIVALATQCGNKHLQFIFAHNSQAGVLVSSLNLALLKQYAPFVPPKVYPLRQYQPFIIYVLCILLWKSPLFPFMAIEGCADYLNFHADYQALDPWYVSNISIIFYVSCLFYINDICFYYHIILFWGISLD